jgi:hypothetical protein
MQEGRRVAPTAWWFAVAGGYGEVTGWRRGRGVFGSIFIPVFGAIDHEPAVGMAQAPAVRTRATPKGAWYWRSAWQCIVLASLSSSLVLGDAGWITPP